MKIKKIAACMAVTVFTLQNIVSVKAVTPKDIGFDYYDGKKYSVLTVYMHGTQGKNVYYENKLIGKSFIDVMRVRKNGSSTTTKDAYMVRVTSTPNQTYNSKDGCYYGGVNQLCMTRIAYLPGQTSLTYSPIPSAPVSERTSSSEFGVGLDKDGLSGTYSLGTSCSYQDSAFQILTHDIKTHTQIEYDYLPTTKCDVASKRKNKWLTNSHDSYFIYNFLNDTEAVEKLDFQKTFIDYEFGYKCYVTCMSNWDGYGLDFVLNSDSNQYYRAAYSYK